MFRVCKNFVSGSLFNKFAFVYYSHMTANGFYNADFVGDYENSYAEFFIDILKKFKDCFCSKGIQCGSGFVSKKN